MFDPDFIAGAKVVFLKFLVFDALDMVSALVGLTLCVRGLSFLFHPGSFQSLICVKAFLYHSFHPSRLMEESEFIIIAMNSPSRLIFLPQSMMTFCL